MDKIKKIRRRSYLVTPEFILRMKKTQGKIKAVTGIEPSLTDLAEEMINVPEFDDVERKIIEKMAKDTSIGIKFDRELR